MKRSAVFTAAELVRRAKEKYEDQNNGFCFGQLDYALDAALLDMKNELAELHETVEEKSEGFMLTPDHPDWEKLERAVEEKVVTVTVPDILERARRSMEREPAIEPSDAVELALGYFRNKLIGLAVEATDIVGGPKLRGVKFSWDKIMRSARGED